MTTPIDISEAINQLIVATDVNCKAVYKQFCPQDFERPSHYVEFIREEISSDNATLVKVASFFRIVSFVNQDERGDCNGDDLLAAQTLVMNMFRKQYLQVGDRALTVKASRGGDDGIAVITDLEFEYFDDKEEIKPSSAPIISNGSSIKIKI